MPSGLGGRPITDPREPVREVLERRIERLSDLIAERLEAIEQNVSQGEAVAHEMAGRGDRAVEERDLLAHRGHDRVDRSPVGFAVGRARNGVGKQVAADQRSYFVRAALPLIRVTSSRN